MTTNIKKLKIAAILTGRGNNTLADKNILPVAGKPLLYYPAKAAYESEYITEYYVSSDCPKILKEGKKAGYTKIKRPLKYSRPDSQHEDVIVHALDHLRKEGNEPDIVVILLANNPCVKTEWIDECIKELVNDEKVTSASPVYLEADHHPFRTKKINKDGNLEPFFNFTGVNVSTNRQDLEPNYFFCHNFWVLRTSNFKNKNGQPPWKFMGDRIKPYIIPQTFDVHETEDLSKSEKWLRNEGII